MTVMNGYGLRTATQEPPESLYRRIAELEQANQVLQTECAAARAAQQQSDALLHALVKHVPNALAIFDQDMRYLLASDRFLTDYGIADQQVIGRRHYDVFPDIPQRWREIHQRSLAGSIERAEEDVFVREDGTIIYNRWECRPWYTSQGGIGGIIMMTEVITEHKRVEEELRQLNAELEQRVIERTAAVRQSQELLQYVIDNLPIIVAVVDPQGRYLLVNKDAAAQFGLTPTDIVGKYEGDFFAPEVVAQWKLDKQELATSGARITSKDLVPFDNKLRNFMVIKFPIYDDQKNLYAFGSIAIDITAQVQQEAELRLFKTIVERANDAIAMIDIDSTIIFSNPAHRALLNYGDEIIGTSLIETIDPQEYSRLEGIYQELQEQGTWRGELTHSCKDGKSVPCEISIFPIPDDNTANIKLVGILHDISDRKQAEAERAALQQQIIDTQRATLHELSTPLIPLSDKIVVMPLVGAIDSARAQQIMDTLLEGTAQHRSAVVILDITGVQVVDTQVANALLRAAQAVKLLGAQVILTGIRPHIAQTLINLGVDLQGIVTRSTLQTGVAYALERFGRA